MGREPSLRTQAAHFVSDLTTVLLNPISDKPHEDMMGLEKSQQESIADEDMGVPSDVPDTSSFTAFLYSLLSSSESGSCSNVEGQNGYHAEMDESTSDVVINETSGRKTLLARGKHSLSRAIYKAARIYGSQNQDSESNGDYNMNIDDGNDLKGVGIELRHVQTHKNPESWVNLPDMSEPSLLLSEKTRSTLYFSLPALAQGRKWVLLYSTWRHGISLSTLYRRSMLCPGFSLLVVGDRKGAVFGGLVEAPLRATSKRKYQGTNNTFVFTNTSVHPVVFRPTGANRYFTLCSTDFLALGGGDHFALYLDSDLLNGSSSTSETYGNSCLALSKDFEVKEVELWGFAYASKYEETVALCRTEAPGICRW
ncbi:hypothetical protein HHK36_004024 [Tetracentron sinense]|uniref:Oxidation resistance protein 1 n=1 Tax=Tetracentron sinense TaxID=13715 RepID=A0A834ZUG3_TETSI|nr:hypothetical protein HHK36_004024 [Tetracentron sinense]